MKSDLRNLVTAQEAYFSDNDRQYAPSVAAMGSNYKVSTDVTIEIVSVNATGWRARATTPLIPTVCELFTGPDFGPKKDEGEPRCNPETTLRWLSMTEMVVLWVMAIVAIVIGLSSRASTGRRVALIGAALTLAIGSLVPETATCSDFDPRFEAVVLLAVVVGLFLSLVMAVRGAGKSPHGASPG